MTRQWTYEDLGLIDYKEAWDLQEGIHNHIVSSKLEDKTGQCQDTLLFCEHPHVYTLGKSGNAGNLLITDELLRNIGAVFYKTNRGGDITYHGPGQIVGYPLLDLAGMNLGIKNYIHLLEQSIIDTLTKFGIRTERFAGATGVWIDTQKPASVRKICAIGVRVSRLVSMHGFALNVNTDLNYFTYINPCGFTNLGVTSMEKELGYKVNTEEVKAILLKKLADNFGIDIQGSN